MLAWSRQSCSQTRLDFRPGSRLDEDVNHPYQPATSSKPGRDKTVVVAMSGGVDSSVAAALLKEQGYQVIGIALQTTDYSKYRNDNTGGTCCSIQDMEDARRVAESLKIPFYVLDTEKTFDSEVVDYFIQDYLQGRTPNPCVMCNTKVKFNHLFKKAMDMGADFVATGHYAKVSREPELGYCLWRGEDAAKDQTYFLFNLTQNQLSKTLFPVGHLVKTDVRRLATEFRLPVAEKPDSQEICFVPGNDYSGFIESRTAATLRKPGYIVTQDKVILGTHNGVFHYTIGQRKGLGDALDKAKALQVPHAPDLYVVQVDAMRNLVVLGPESALKQWGLTANRVNWIAPPDLYREKLLKVKIRSRHEAVPALVEQILGNQVRVRFLDPQRAITPGQACVFYDGNLCLGGGWIQDPLHLTAEERASREQLPSSDRAKLDSFEQAR